MRIDPITALVLRKNKILVREEDIAYPTDFDAEEYARQRQAHQAHPQAAPPQPPPQPQPAAPPPSWGSMAAHYGGRALSSLGTAAGAAGSAVSSAAGTAANAVGDALHSSSPGAGKLATGVSQAYHTAEPHLKTAVSAVLNPLTHPVTMGAGAAAGIVFGAHTLIQNFMTKAAQDCKDVPDKAGCIRQHKQQGSQAAIERLRSQIPQCRGDMDCMKKIRRAMERMGGEA
jgi:hypothetical protein